MNAELLQSVLYLFVGISSFENLAILFRKLGLDSPVCCGHFALHKPHKLALKWLKIVGGEFPFHRGTLFGISMTSVQP